MKVTKWKIFYDDGTTFSSSDGEAKEAPMDGVQVIVEWFDNGTIKVTEGMEYYWWTGDCWAFGRLNDLERWLRALLPELKFGRFTKNAVHQAAIKEAHGSH
jgi:hypothetical protein